MDSPGIITATRPIATQFDGHRCMGEPTTDVALIRKLRGSLMCLAYILNMLSMGVCTTRHWQESSQLVQKLNVCTVVYIIIFKERILSHANHTKH